MSSFDFKNHCENIKTLLGNSPNSMNQFARTAFAKVVTPDGRVD